MKKWRGKISRGQVCPVAQLLSELGNEKEDRASDIT